MKILNMVISFLWHKKTVKMLNIEAASFMKPLDSQLKVMLHNDIEFVTVYHRILCKHNVIQSDMALPL